MRLLVVRVSKLSSPLRSFSKTRRRLSRISGVRVVPAELRTATIHRLELPQGRFERRIALPAGRYESVRRAAVNGCLVISLTKSGAQRGRP